MNVKLGISLLLTGAVFGQILPVNRSHAQKTPPFGVTFQGTVERVIDGDTIVVRPAPRLVTVRLLDCWAPETRTKNPQEKALGIKAKAFMFRLAQRKTVKVHIPQIPRAPVGDAMSFGRSLANVYLEDGRSLSAVMVEAGHATKDKVK